MADRSKFTDEEWVERSYRKITKAILNNETRQNKLSQRLQEKMDHLDKRDKDLEIVKAYKRDGKGNIQISLEDGTFRDLHFDSDEKLQEYIAQEIKALQDKKEYVQKDFEQEHNKTRVLMELKLENLEREKNFWNSTDFDNQKQKFGYQLKKSKNGYTKLKKDKIYKIDYAKDELEGQYKKHTGKKKVDLSFGKKVQELMNKWG